MTIRLLSARARRAVPWKNGGGITREIAAGPEAASLDAFDWRVSLAEVATAGPFSRFEGVDRLLTVLEGELALSFAGEPPVRLGPESEPYAFPGERDCEGSPGKGLVVDLNVMVRRGAMRAEVRRLRAEAALAARGEVLVVLALEAGRIEGLALEPFDALLADAGERLTPERPLRLVAVDLFRR